MRFAELNERTQIRHKYPIRDVTINVGTHSERVPGEQAAFCAWEYHAVGCLFVIKLTCSRREERDRAGHPFVRLSRTSPRVAWRLANVHIHS